MKKEKTPFVERYRIISFVNTCLLIKQFIYSCYINLPSLVMKYIQNGKKLQKKPSVLKLKLGHLLFVFSLVSWEVFAGALCSGMPWFVSG